MFADGTNCFYSHIDIKSAFTTANKQLTTISNWFHANELSVNTDKTKYIFFQKLKHNQPLHMQAYGT